MSYTDSIAELQKRIDYYLQNGYFGQNQEVIKTIREYIKLLAYLHGAYESAISKYAVQEGRRINEGFFDKLKYKRENQWGVKQQINDKNKNKYSVGKQNNGQWMVNLQNDLKKFEQWNFLHGAKTKWATEAFIMFLEVEKQSLWGGFKANFQKPLLNMKKALIGVALLGGMLGNINSCGTNGGAVPPGQQGTSQPGVEQTTTQNQQKQGINVNFAVDSSELSPQDVQNIQNLPPGTYNIVLHQSTNSSGVDATYEKTLMDQRVTAIERSNPNCTFNVERGDNAQTPSAEILPGGTASFFQ